MWSILPSLPAYGGLVLSLWSSAYVATRTGYASNTRLVRLALIIAGAWWLAVFLGEQALSDDAAPFWLLCFLPVATLASSLWCLWIARNLPGTPHLSRGWRYPFLLPAAVVALLALRPLLVGPLPLLRIFTAARQPTVGSVAVVATMVTESMLGGAAIVIARALGAVASTRARRALLWMLAGTLLMGLGALGQALWGWRVTPISAAGQILLIAGNLATAYGTVTYVLRERRRTFTLDFLTSGAAACVIALVYLVLVDFIVSRAGTGGLPYLLVVQTALATLLIFYGEGLRMILDRLRIGRARQLDVKLLRLLVHRLSAPHVPAAVMLQETLGEIAGTLRADQLALVWFEGESTRLLASWGNVSVVLPHPDILRYRRVRACNVEGFTHSVPLLEDGEVRGVLLIGGWRVPNTAVHLYSELEYLGALLAVLVRHAHLHQPDPLDGAITDAQIDADQQLITWRLKRFPKAQVYVRILGILHLEYNRKKLEIPTRPIGRVLLSHIIGYLVITRGTYSTIDTLKEVTRSRKLPAAKPGRLPNPELNARLKRVFEKDWKLPKGMVTWDGKRVRFEQSPVWYTDIDLIEAYLSEAESEVEAGNMRGASEYFAAAHALCAVDVLGDMNFIDDADQHLRAVANQWASTHKHLLQAYGEHLLRDGERESRQLVLKLAHELVRVYGDDEVAVRVAARLAEHAGERMVARKWYERAMKTGEESPPPDDATDALMLPVRRR
jgi:hypothetical protein